MAEGKRGTPNRLTKELRTILKDLIHEELSQLPFHLDSLEAKDRLEILIRIMPYALPKVNKVSSKEDEPFDW